MRILIRLTRICCLVLMVASLGGCSKSSDDSEDCPPPDLTYNPSINPADFVSTIDNPLLPFVPGTRYVYQSSEERSVVTVTNDTKLILGVTTIVVHDVVSAGGQITEDTYDWYAQDTAGNVWYFGEDAKQYEGGKLVGTEGSWEAGVDGAKPGIVMHAIQPAIDSPYRQEYYTCVAEDQAEVVSLSEPVTVPYGSFANCLQTHEFSDLEPDANEDNYYAPGVGLVVVVDLNTGLRTELIEVTTP
jgi:hypothetical protein